MKGPSLLQTIPNFDLFKGMSFDYMHLALLGVTRKLLQLWFTRKHHKEIWYLGNATKDIDGLLCQYALHMRLEELLEVLKQQ